MLVVDALGPEAASLQHSHEIDDVVVADRVQRLVGEERHEVDAQRRFDGGDRRALAPAAAEVALVARTGRSDREALRDRPGHLHLGDQPPQLGLGLRTREPVAAASGAPGPDLAVLAPTVDVRFAIPGLAPVTVGAGIEAPGA